MCLPLQLMVYPPPLPLPSCCREPCIPSPVHWSNTHSVPPSFPAIIRTLSSATGMLHFWCITWDGWPGMLVRGDVCYPAGTLAYFIKKKKRKKEFMLSQYVDCRVPLWPMSQSLTQPGERGPGTVNVDDDCIFLVVFLVISTKPTFSLCFLNFVVSPLSHMSPISCRCLNLLFPLAPVAQLTGTHLPPPPAFTSLHQDRPVLLWRRNTVTAR